MTQITKEQLARKLQRKFNYNRAEYARHPEKDQFFDDMAEEAIYQIKQEEYDFLDQILHMPFFEFCLQVKERKQRLEKELGK